MTDQTKDDKGKGEKTTSAPLGPGEVIVETEENFGARAERTPEEKARPGNGVESAEGEQESPGDGEDAENKDQAKGDDGQAAEDGQQAAGDGEDGEQPADQRKKKSRATERKLQRLRRRARKAEEKAAQLEGRLAEFERGAQDAGGESDNMPKVEDYDDYDDFVVAVGKWARGAKSKAARTETKSTKEADYKPHPDEHWDDFRDKYGDDWDDVVSNPGVPITVEMLKALKDSEYDGDVLWYLGNNRKEARKISRLGPVEAAQAIEDIEDKIASGDINEAEEDGKKKKPPTNAMSQQRSAAIKPSKPIKSGASTADTKANPAKMSMDEYVRYRRRQEREQSRGF